MLTKEQIQAKAARRLDTVEVEGWGTVALKAFTLAERAQFEDESIAVFGTGSPDIGPLRAYYSRLAAASIVDANGEPMFSEAEILAMSSEAAEAIAKIADASLLLNGFRRKAVDDAAKK